MTALEFNYKMLQNEVLLQRFAIKLTADRDAAKDLLQETYLKALNYRERMRDERNFKGWLTTIMKNTFINNYRKSSRKLNSVDNEKTTYVLLNQPARQQENPEDQLRHKELQALVAQIGDDFRIPFEMHFQGFKYKEIAVHLDLKIGTVKSRIFSARKQIQALMH